MKNALTTFLQSSLLILWALLGLSLLGVGCYTAWTPYEQFTTTLLEAVHKLDWRPYFQSTVLPLGRYQLLPYLLGGAFFCWLILSPWFVKKSPYWSRLLQLFFRYSQQQQTSFWSSRSRTEWLFLSGIIGLAIFRMLYYLGHYALQYDEAWTYNHFVANGFWVAAISPNNNHILYTLLACLTDYLPISGQYSLRLPVMLGGVVLLFVFYKLGRQNSSTPWALLGLSFLAFAPAASLYSLYARGYIFQLLFTVLALSSTGQVVSTNNKKTYHWTWWVLAHVLGLYSVPTHAYVLVVMSSFLLWKGHSSLPFLQQWAKANAAVFCCSMLLYAPYLLTNGSSVLWAAASQGPRGEALWAYQDKVADWLLWGGGRGTPVYGLWLALVGLLFFLYYKNKLPKNTKALTELTLLFLLLPTLLNLLTGAQPPYRVWCFLGSFLALSGVFIGQAFAPHWNNKKGLFLALLIIISGYTWRLQHHYALQWSAQLDWQVKAIAEQLLAADIQACYLFSNYDKPLLEYYYLRQGKRLTTHLVSPNSKDFAPFEQFPLYEAVLWDAEDRVPSPKEQAWLKQYYPIVVYKDTRVQLHLPKPVD